jgi:hypothetical protein
MSKQITLSVNYRKLADFEAKFFIALEVSRLKRKFGRNVEQVYMCIWTEQYVFI